jgi:hypothetical protein
MVKSGGGGTRDDTLTAVDARTGKTLWQAKHPPSGYSSPENVFVIDGVVWCDHSSNGRSDGTVVGYDLKSGKERHRFAADQKSYWFHHRCYPGRATSEYLLTSRTGIEFVNLDSEKWDLNHWVRGACLYGIMPATAWSTRPGAVRLLCRDVSCTTSMRSDRQVIPGSQSWQIDWKEARRSADPATSSHRRAIGRHTVARIPEADPRRQW